MSLTMLRYLTGMILLQACLSPSGSAADSPESLSDTLASESLAALAKAAREEGDPGRGAALFFQSSLNCARCHSDDSGNPIGPDLARLGKEATAESLIESVLKPSKAVRKGYESAIVSTTDGRTYAGRVINETNEHVALIDPSANGSRVELKTSEIVARVSGEQSLMPEGLVNLLSDRRQFLDLSKYLIEIAEHGPNRERELRPSQASPAIPAYETDIDHAGLIRALDQEAFRRGEAIYDRVCANCHGTADRPGSMPTSPRFGADRLKNGGDPHRLYQTLTRGYGMMAPQTWMVPRQKYDVIHYIREFYFKARNPSQYAKVDSRYLDGLPKGTKLGPAASNFEPWVAMDYGPSLMNTYEIGEPVPNFAYKGVAIRLDSGPGGVSRGAHWAVFDHDTMRLAAAWNGRGFIDWKGIHFDGRHQVHPKLVGEVVVANPSGPGWANPDTGRFDDPRIQGRDGRRYGPLPRRWAKYKGTYHYGDKTIVSYTVGTATILESFDVESDPSRPGAVIHSRTLEVGPRSQEIVARLAPKGVAVAIVGSKAAVLFYDQDFTLLKIPVSRESVLIKVLTANGKTADSERLAKASPPPRPLSPLTEGGPRHWPETLTLPATFGKNDGPFAVDTFATPERNPWNAQVRLTGFDFSADGARAYACTWDGDVWAISGLDKPVSGLSWRRIASGLFQPLGLKLREGEIYVSCRDQIVRLRDLNGDGETDFYECINNDHQVTEHFHEFAMGLQTDDEGNFYYAKSGRHALPALVPQHGTLLKVSKDGETTEILASGFRAANGVCLNSDGTFFVTDQEGFWTPKNRINLVEKGGFYGNMFGYTDLKDSSDAAMKQPLCWITNEFDRSPAEMLRVSSDRWGPLKGSLLNLSYGQGKIHVVPYEKVNGQAQGGVCALPIPMFPTGIMRGRFHPKDGQLYVCGMFAWAGNRTQPGGLYRVRYTGKPIDLPIGLKARSSGIEITFTDRIDPTSASDVRNYELKVWDLKRSQNYGSPHLNERSLSVAKATRLSDGATIRLELPKLAPTRGMEIKYRLKGTDGRAILGVVHNTIHEM